MELVIPDGAQVHITIGQPPLLALPYDTNAVTSPSRRPRGRIAKVLLAGVSLVVTFQAGRLLPHHVDTASAARPTAAIVAPGMTEGSAAGEIPPAFRAQMAQPAQVVSPPGAAPAASPGESTGSAKTPATTPTPPNPFGLQG